MQYESNIFLKFYIYKYDNTTAPSSFVKTDISTQITSLSAASFDLGDFDQDIDLVISGFSSDSGIQSYLYENITVMGEAYQFQNIADNLIAVKDGTSDFIDIDGDGNLDAVLTGMSVDGDVFDV